MASFLTPQIAALPATVPFVGPEAQERRQGFAFLARLGANENGFGPSPRARQAMADAAGEVWKYPDPENCDLHQALAAHHAIPPEHLQLGEGIDALLGYLCRMTVAPGIDIVTSDGAYPTFNYHVAGCGGRLHKVPFRDDHEDLEALLHTAKTTGARLIYLSNPDNPMGTWHDGAALEALIDDLPETTLLILDEAYLETAPPGTAPPMMPDRPNVIRLRTFSKAYGLAGARVGYAIGPRDLIEGFARIRNHFGLNRIAQVGALAALEDQTYLTDCVKKIARARDRIADMAQANGLHPIDSATNFVTVDCGADAGFARAVLQDLAARKIFLRMPGPDPLNRCIRIGCGDADDLDFLERHLPQALKAARSVQRPLDNPAP